MFSVIITCFNEVEILHKTVASLAAQQDAPDYEVVLVDNNSDLEDINEVYETWVRDLDILLVKQPRLASTYALCQARNLGLRVARHPWIVSLDADCMANPYYLAKLADAVLHEPYAIFTGERIFVDASAVTSLEVATAAVDLDDLPVVRSASNYYQARDRRMPHFERLHDSAHPWSYFHGGNLIFSRKVAMSVGGFDTRYDGHWGYEDIDFAYRVIAEGGCIPRFRPGFEVYHQEPVAVGSMTERFNKRANPNWERICRAIPGFREHKEREYRQFTEVTV